MQYDILTEHGFWVIPLVVAIVQSIKMTGIATKFAPIISIGVGVGLAFLVNVDFTLPQQILSGVIYGLSASGLYSGVRVTQNVNDVKSGKIPLEKVDKDILNEKDLQAVQQNQDKQNP